MYYILQPELFHTQTRWLIGHIILQLPVEYNFLSLLPICYYRKCEMENSKIESLGTTL